MGFSSLPSQANRKSVKKGFDFTLMVAGQLNTHTLGSQFIGYEACLFCCVSLEINHLFWLQYFRLGVSSHVF